MDTSKRTFFTPGPLTLSDTVMAAMQRDWGSRDSDFVDLTAGLLQMLGDLLQVEDDAVVVPVQGSGTFAVEAMIGSIVPASGKLLVLENGLYGQRIAKIAATLGRTFVTLAGSNLEALRAADVEQALQADPSISHVAVVHLETGSGLLNPVAQIAEVVQRAGRGLLVDAMSTVGCMPLTLRSVPCHAMAFSSNKCLQGPPGLGFVLARTAALRPGISPSLVLDLYQQWQLLAQSGQWRFTPPTHIVAGTHAALQELQAEGGAAARLMRYQDNCAAILEICSAKLGLVPLLSPAVRSPVILALQAPQHPAFNFDDLYESLKAASLYIYPGVFSGSATFRIGCIGAIDRTDMIRLADALTEYWDKQQLRLT